jgi:hypothetical protein
MKSDSIQGVMTGGDIMTAAQRQYYARPADQKFSSLDELYAKVHSRRMSAIEFESDIVDMSAHQSPGGGVVFSAKGNFMQPTHWAFGQTAALIGAPAAYLRKLSTQGAEDIVVKLLNHGIAKREAAGFKFLAVDEPNGDDTTLYAATSPSYGRIWDADVVESTKRVIDAQDGKFFSPWAWGHKHRALFGSSQDVFMYFIDGGSIVDGGGERDQLHRGVYVWNSEVGAATFGIATFLFRETCGNFLVWGVENAKILNIRHTSGGPERFVSDAVPALQEFARTSVKQLEAGVKAAKAFALPTDEDELLKFGIKHGFNRAETKRAILAANTEEGSCATLWDLVNGFTATARMMAFADAKADLEVRAGKLMKIAEHKTNAKVVLAN